MHIYIYTVYIYIYRMCLGNHVIYIYIYVCSFLCYVCLNLSRISINTDVPSRYKQIIKYAFEYRCKWSYHSTLNPSWLIVTNIYVTHESHRRIASDDRPGVGKYDTGSSDHHRYTLAPWPSENSLDAPWCTRLKPRIERLTLMLDWASAMQLMPQNCWLVVTGTWMDYDFPIILGMSSSQLLLTPSFFRGVGWNHQPDWHFWWRWKIRPWPTGLSNLMVGCHDSRCSHRYLSPEICSGEAYGRLARKWRDGSTCVQHQNERFHMLWFFNV